MKDKCKMIDKYDIEGMLTVVASHPRDIVLQEVMSVMTMVLVDIRDILQKDLERKGGD